LFGSRRLYKNGVAFHWQLVSLSIFHNYRETQVSK
jgi:hypothetical protein